MRESLTKTEQAVAELVRETPIDDADLIGRFDRIVRELTAYKRAWLAELSEPLTGKKYRVPVERSAKRSYNTAALLYGFAEQGATIQDLIREGVVRLSWQWTRLKQVAYSEGVTLSIAPHELDTDDLDEPMVGEVWSERYKVEGV